jgi:hypothetical protein
MVTIWLYQARTTALRPKAFERRAASGASVFSTA